MSPAKFSKNFLVTTTSALACACDFGATRMMSLVKYSTTSGLRISSAKRIVTSPYTTYLSGALNGLCNPDFGHAAAERAIASNSSSDVVFGATTNVFRSFAFIGSTTYSTSSSVSIGRHVPPTRLAHLAAPPVAALIFHGFAVGFAHAGTNAAAEDDDVEDDGVEDEDDVELEVATARALVVARIIVLVIIIPHRLDAPRRSAAVVIALVVGARTQSLNHSITQSLNRSIDRSRAQTPTGRRRGNAGTRECENAGTRPYRTRVLVPHRHDRAHRPSIDLSSSLPLFLSSSRVSHSRRVINPIHRLNRYSSESSHQCRCDAIEFDADELHCIEGRSMEDRGRRIERKRDEERRWVEARSRCVVSSNARDDDDPRWCR